MDRESARRQRQWHRRRRRCISTICRRRSRRRRSMSTGGSRWGRRSSAACRSRRQMSRAVCRRGRRHHAVACRGPDVKLDASGRLALGRAATSDLKYHINAHRYHRGRPTSPVRRARRRGRSRRHSHRQRRVASDERDAERQRLGLRREQDRSISTARTTSRSRIWISRMPACRRRAPRRLSSSAATEINQLTAKTTYAQKRLEFETTRPATGAGARRNRQRDLSPRSSGAPPSRGSP